MPPSRPTGIRSTPATARRFVARGMVMALVWLGLNGPDWRSWIVGGPMVLAAAWLSLGLLPAGTWRWSVREVFAFGGYFLRESLRGGWWVARHALSARLAISPGLVHHRFRLPPGPARWFFCSAISLLPGTAVVAIEGDSLSAHVLDRSLQSAEELGDLERRIAALFGLAWVEPGESAP